MKRRDFITLVGGAAAAWPLAARGQQSARRLVGFFSSRSPEDSAYLVAAFHRGLSEQGYIEGQNVEIKYQWARGQWDRLPAIAADLARRNVAVIVAAGGEPAALAAKAATTSIPIVFATGGDPVKLGIVSSFNRPGGNMTGTMVVTTDLESKRLGLLSELLPDAALTGVMMNPRLPQAEATLREVQEAARTLGRRVLILHASNEPELNSVLTNLAQQNVKALLITADPFFDTQRAKLIAFAAQHSIPAIYQFREYALAGGLMSYGASLTDNYRWFGVYTGRILRGEKPAELPIVQSVKFEFVINLKTAKALGLEVPPTLLARADEVIE